jgi:hypothetical protein
MAKLTLSVDPQVIARAKAMASERGTSISALVESYLDLLTRPRPAATATPVLARLRGILAGSDPDSRPRARR